MRERRKAATLISSSLHLTDDKKLLEIIQEYLSLYMSGFKLKDIRLEKTYYSYQINECFKITLGFVDGRGYYIVETPFTLDTLSEDLLREIARKIVSEPGLLEIDQARKLNDLNSENCLRLMLASGLGLILPLVLDPHIEDVYVSKSKDTVYVVHNTLSWMGWIETNIHIDPRNVDRLVLAISRRAGKHISLVNPIAEGTLYGSLRVSLVYGDSVSPIGSSIVIRKRGGKDWTITRLIAEGTISPVIASYLWLVLENKGWIIIGGHVGAGKTSLLQGLLTLIPPNKKIISIEDTPEINYSTGLWEPLIERAEVFTSAPAIDSYILLKFALRRRPDYIVIGEVRGVEARLLVQASRLGHGVMNTIHADSPDSVLKRLVSPPISIAKNLLNNIWAIVITGMDQQGRRRILSVSEVTDDSAIYSICHGVDQCDIEKIIHGSYKLRKIYDAKELRREIERRAIFLRELTEEKVYDPGEIATRLLRFYDEMKNTN